MATNTPKRAIPSCATVQDATVRLAMDSLKANVEELYSGYLSIADATAMGLVRSDRGTLYSPLTNTTATGSATTARTSQAVGQYTKALTWDSADGSNADVGTHNMWFSLPTGCRVTRAWYEVVTSFASGGAAVVSIGIDTDDADGILAPTAIGAALNAGAHECIQDGAAANFSEKTTASRNLYVKVAVAALTDGRLNLFLEYAQTA